MADDKLDKVENRLDQALLRMQELEERLKRGEDVPEEEMTAIAKQVANSLEDALDQLKAVVGPEHQQALEKEMIQRMSPQEFDEWSRNYALREAMRAERKKKENGDG